VQKCQNQRGEGAADKAGVIKYISSAPAEIRMITFIIPVTPDLIITWNIYVNAQFVTLCGLSHLS